MSIQKASLLASIALVAPIRLSTNQLDSDQDHKFDTLVQKVSAKADDFEQNGNNVTAQLLQDVKETASIDKSELKDEVLTGLNHFDDLVHKTILQGKEKFVETDHLFKTEDLQKMQEDLLQKAHQFDTVNLDQKFAN